jgi:hypothetical protein
MAVFEESHGVVVAAVGEPVKVVVVPTQADKVPEIVGAADTVTVTVLVQLFAFL